MTATYNFELGEDREHRNMNQFYDPYLRNNPSYQQPLQPQTFPTNANSFHNPLHPISMSSFINSGQDLLLFRRDDDEDDEEEAKSCANISQNLLYCSIRYTSTYIGTRKFLTKPLWVYSHLKSDFFSEKKLLNVI